MNTTHRLAGLSTIVLSALTALACSNDTSPPIMGSGHMTESSTEALRIDRVSVSLPFQSTLWNGERRQLVLRGEDNLIAEVTVEETAPGQWTITAPFDLAFEQHADIEIEIPYIDMVELFYEGEVSLGDDPIDVWDEARR